MISFVVRGKRDTILHCRVEEQEYEEEDRARDVDEAVDPVRPVEEQRVLQEPALDVEFEEDVEALLEVNELQGMSAGDVHGALNHRHGAEGASKLVYLCMLVGCCKAHLAVDAYPVDQSPIPCLNQERELLEQLTQKVVLEPSGVWRCDLFAKSKDSHLTCSPFWDFVDTSQQ